MPLEVAQLCERLGWMGTAGFERIHSVPGETVRDWLFIAKTEREIEEKRRAN